MKNQTNRLKTEKNRKLLLGVAILCFLLGTGNITYGYHRKKEYKALLVEARQSKNENNNVILPFVGKDVNVQLHDEHIKRIKSRLDYYNFVNLGGKVFLACSGMLLLLFLVTAYDRESKLL
jgi:hypothetical protein